MNDRRADYQADASRLTLELGPHARLVFEPGTGQVSPQLAFVLQIQAPSNDTDEGWPRHFIGIENHVYAEVEGLGRATTFVDATRSEQLSDVIAHRLIFEFTQEQVEAIRLGADLGFGVNDDRMRVGVRASGKSRQVLLDILR